MEEHQIINNYRVIKKLGESKVVEVFLCIKDSQRYTLKVQKVQEDEVGMCEASQDFIKEISALEKGRHPFVIDMIESFQWEDENHKFRWCIVLEYADGGDLIEKYCHQKIKVLEKQALTSITQIILALEHLSKFGIKTFDVNPQSLVLVSENLGESVKIGNLYIKIEDQSECCSKKSVYSSLYLAPENLLKGDSPLQSVWSLGVILYELLTGGEHPYENTSDSSNYLSRLSRLTLKSNPLINAALMDLLRLMLEKDASKRITISELLNQPLIAKQIDEYITEMTFGKQITEIITRQTG
ncbi:hypothetical protein FGO68_gene6819 [Halteria grandinella]|uniref:non-specific serine/threonine protein kinase n=1 Tax=Halteria grandinella TaxID=5974 RepID=A0A8J8T3E3_HALGN|nr:hypothetical protein FGO68_gene6819 [Halteria grandinella]